MKANKLFTLLLGSAMLLTGGCSGASTVEEDAAATTGPINVGGSAEAYEAIELLIDGYEAEVGEFETTFFPPSQTSGGIEGVKQAALDIGGVSRKLSADETADELNYVLIGETPLVIAVHESVTGITNITADQIQGIYRGDITNWQELGGPDAEIILLDLPEDENEKQVLRGAYLGEDLEITSKAVVFREDDEMLETIGNSDFSMAAVPLEDEIDELPVTILNIDGVSPSLKTIQSGEYKMSLPIGFVTTQSPAPEVQALIDFMTTPEGQAILMEAEFIAP
ncbi:MAG: substrate-binding domain-containing protein [Cyanobacteria bacterium P01_D01_bin.115]